MFAPCQVTAPDGLHIDGDDVLMWIQQPQERPYGRVVEVGSFRRTSSEGARRRRRRHGVGCERRRGCKASNISSSSQTNRFVSPISHISIMHTRLAELAVRGLVGRRRPRVCPVRGRRVIEGWREIDFLRIFR